MSTMGEQHVAAASLPCDLLCLNWQSAMQYEAATDNVQSIREKLELERAAKLEWLRSAAATCAHSFAAANGNAEVSIQDFPCQPITIH